MQRVTSTVLAMLLTLALSTPSAFAWGRGAANTFATLPAGAAHPEGITVDATGNVYLTTFDVTKSSGPETLLVFSSNGHLLRQVAVACSSNLLLDLAFHPTTGALCDRLRQADNFQRELRHGRSDREARVYQYAEATAG